MASLWGRLLTKLLTGGEFLTRLPLVSTLLPVLRKPLWGRLLTGGGLTTRLTTRPASNSPLLPRVRKPLWGRLLTGGGFSTRLPLTSHYFSTSSQTIPRPHFSANSTTCRATVVNCINAARSAHAPLASKIASAVFSPAPSGVGHPRNACTIDRNASSAVPIVCHPFAVMMQPTARPSR